MTFLEICQAVFREGGVSGAIASVQNQTGEALRVVKWSQLAYQEILNDQGIVWNFLRRDAKVQLTKGKGEYSFGDLGLYTPDIKETPVQWDARSMRVARNEDLSDETFLQGMRYPDFRNFWLFSSRRTTEGRPLNVSVNPETKLCIGPIPEQDYWLALEYQIMPGALVEQNDQPFVLPERYHMAIVWRALRHYGAFEAAPEVVMRAELAYKTIMQQLEQDQSFEVVVGGPLC